MKGVPGNDSCRREAQKHDEDDEAHHSGKERISITNSGIMERIAIRVRIRFRTPRSKHTIGKVGKLVVEGRFYRAVHFVTGSRPLSPGIGALAIFYTQH